MPGGQYGGRLYMTGAEYARRVERDVQHYVAAIRNGGLTLKELKQSGVNQNVLIAVRRKLAESAGYPER